MTTIEGSIGKERPKQGHTFIREHSENVTIGFFDVADNSMNVGKVGLDELGLEFGRIFRASIHKDNVDNVIAYMPLTFYLKIEVQNMYRFSFPSLFLLSGTQLFFSLLSAA